MQEGAFKQPIQRFGALHLLHSLTRFQPPAKNPFAPFLVQVCLRFLPQLSRKAASFSSSLNDCHTTQAIQDPARPFQERLFIQLLLIEDKPPEGTIFEAAVGIKQIPSRPIPAAEEFWRILQDRSFIALRTQLMDPRFSLLASNGKANNTRPKQFSVNHAFAINELEQGCMMLVSARDAHAGRQSVQKRTNSSQSERQRKGRVQMRSRPC